MKITPPAESVRAARELVVLNELGLHARPATEFVRCVRTFHSQIHIVRGDGSRFRADRILDILMADLPQGAAFRLKAVGPDAEAAADRIERLMKELV